MIKVLYILPALKFGGIEQYLLNLVDQIDKNRFELEVLCVGNESALIQASELTEERKIALHHFPQPTNFVKKIIKPGKEFHGVAPVASGELMFGRMVKISTIPKAAITTS